MDEINFSAVCLSLSLSVAVKFGSVACITHVCHSVNACEISYECCGCSWSSLIAMPYAADSAATRRSAAEAQCHSVCVAALRISRRQGPSANAVPPVDAPAEYLDRTTVIEPIEVTHSLTGPLDRRRGS